MVQFKYEIVIESPVEEIFDSLVNNLFQDLPQNEEHTTLLIEQLTEGEIDLGTQFRLISAREHVEPDSSISEFLKDLDLNLLEPDLRKQLKETFVGITGFEKNKLLELLLISDEDKGSMSFQFKKVKDGTKLKMSFQYEVRIRGHKIITFFANHLINYVVKKSENQEPPTELKEQFANRLLKSVPPDTTNGDEKRKPINNVSNEYFCE